MYCGGISTAQAMLYGTTYVGKTGTCNTSVGCGTVFAVKP